MEYVIPDVREDVSRILDVRGQVMLISKKSMTDAATVTATVYASALYLTEDGSKIECVSTEIPVEFAISNDGFDENTEIVTEMSLCSLEAKLLNPRKLLFKAKVSADIMCFARGSFSICDRMPEETENMSMHYLEKEAEHNLITAIREKVFTVTDEYGMPRNVSEESQLISTQTSICVDEVKAVGSKLVFKANAFTDAIFFDPEGECVLKSERFETVFSQIIETDMKEDVAKALLFMDIMSADFVKLPDGSDAQFAVTFKVSASAICLEDVVSTYIADAYSNSTELEIEYEEVDLMCVSQQKMMKITAEGVPCEAVMNSQWCYVTPAYVCVSVSENKVTTKLTARGTAMNEHDGYIPVEVELSGEEMIELQEGQSITVSGVCCGDIEAARNGTMSCDVMLNYVIGENSSISTVCAIEFDEESQNMSASRPSLTVLCSKNAGADLWSVAKKYGSTVEAIEMINSSDGVFSPFKRPLLIPKTN